ncbi:NlpC/P60 family protein [Marinilactibacillus sp. Marseille-P9653]|uniref:C40 family peptidase n=1 Tax=Marinilactibacillus sp. Marseille-P9653 TaxID=2866583 RepID=UPI001CE47EAF|nr:NlpC/P60 family protein [Marinilactibacillus sp. Marseille-P9653]
MNKKSILKLTLAASLGLTYLATPAMPVFASPESESEFNQKLENLSKDQNEAEKELEAVASKISEQEAYLNVLMDEMEETNTTLTQLKEEIDTLNTVIADREEKLEEQARAVQVTGDSKSVLNFLMESESLGDIIGRLDVVNTIVSANQNLIQQQVSDKEAVVSKEKETLAQQEEQTLRAAKMESQKAELEEEQANQERLVASIAAEKSDVAEEKETFLAEQKAAEALVKELQAARAAAAETTTIAVSNTTEAATETADVEEEVVSTSSSDSNQASETTPEPAKAPEASVPASSNGGSITGIAHGLKGVRYSFGGGTPAGFDCSGFVQYVFRQAGRSITRTAAGQYSATTRISQSQAQPGDLIFFNQGGSIDHVGIYLGGGSFIGAQTSTGVAVASFTSGYWSNYVAGFGRP